MHTSYPAPSQNRDYNSPPNLERPEKPLNFGATKRKTTDEHRFTPINVEGFEATKRKTTEDTENTDGFWFEL
jgi:hypothetical protein